MQALDANSEQSCFDFPQIPLRAYQKAELALMDKMEAGEFMPRPGVHVRTCFGILGSKVGAGKTITLCALIKSSEHVNPRQRLQQDNIFGTNLLTVRRTIQHPMNRVYSRCTLIVVPHGLQYQWEQELRSTGIDFCKHKDFRPDAVACLVTATKLASFYAEHSHIHFKRLILDEADTIVIRCQPDVHASFIWFVSATYQTIDSSWRLTGARPIYFKCFRYYGATNLELNDVTVRSHSLWIDECNNLPPIQVSTIMCITPAYMNVVIGSSSLSASITEMLTAGDAEGAILAMGGDALTEHNIVDVISARLSKDIQRLQARATYFDQIGSTGAANQTRDSIRSKHQQLSSIQERLAKFREGTCAICLNELACAHSHVITSCCSHLFCGPCLMTWRCRVNTCPMCRANDYRFTLIKDGTTTPQEAAAAPNSRPRTKEEALVEIIDSKPDGKFIVFSSYDRTFDAIHTLLRQHGITCRVLKGTPTTFRKILADHQAGHIKVLLMNSRFDGSGHSMQWVTDAITYHRLAPECLEQVTGRGMRPGRTTPLCMHHLRWECEV